MDSAMQTSLIDSWEAPPPALGQGRRTRADERPWGQLVHDLRQHTGEWALLSAEVPLQTAYDVNAARLSAFRPAGAFEAVTRDGRVYVRHIGTGV